MMNRYMNYMLAGLVLSLAIIGACRGENQSNEMDTEMREELLGLERLITDKTITEGGFEALKIGQKKSVTVSALLDMGVIVVSPNVKNVITVTNPSDLEKVRGSESITLDGPRVALRIKFAGDAVEYINAPPHTDWEEKVKPIKTKEGVFKLLGDVLRSDPKMYVRNLATDTHQIRLSEMTDDDRQLLEKYDAWGMNRDNDAGYWHFHLEFDNDVLTKINMKHSPVELP
ncbi:hypothetical protein MNBD_GAMMA13-954 [hydrothermal vent metagenome]|uniref:Lipoprotein n=1 Tax=hydrothermal vent metagenome TaxID=652676 RepID=A0A3B0YSE4_9ZZZZ